MSVGAVRAGSAFVELFADPKKLEKGLAAASNRLKSWGNSLVGIGSKIFASAGRHGHRRHPGHVVL